jgi:hypothetical protein
MHFVEVSDVAERTQEIVWEGATRRMTEVMRTETSQLEGELNTKFVGLNTKFAEKLFYGEGARDAGAGTVCGVIDGRATIWVGVRSAGEHFDPIRFYHRP